MGGSSNSKRGRKKGRPSQLDLHKRSLRLQKTSSAAASDSDDSGPRQREKKLKHVLRLSADESDDSAGGGARKRRRIAGDLDKSSRGSEDGEDSGTSTPLPDRKLLVLVLDRLQKKDTYGVYSEPVDPEELPDYHDIIKHPMDFRTVREKLADGAYANLEQFEQDVFLISSNAMQYNSADTIYYRQARSIHELAKKDFESLRQESDDNEPEPKVAEPKVVRRGRPPNKNTIKRPVGRPPAERTGSDFSSDAHLANARDNGHWSSMVHDSSIHSTAGVSTRASHGISYAERRNWASEIKSERNDEYSGSSGRGNKMKYGKNSSVIDENRRNTYIHSQSSSTYVQDPLVSTSFNGERKLLVPVGLQIEQAYARSLAMFAAELGPVAWEIAAKRIERVLPPGTRFGSGWVGDSEAPEQSQKLVISTPPPQPNVPPFTGIARDDPHSVKQESSEGKATIEAPLRGNFSSSAATNRPSEPVRSAHLPGGFKVEASSSGIRSNPHLQLQQKLQNPGIQHPVNGFNTAQGFNLLSQVEKMSRQASPLGNFGNEAVMMTHARALDMVSRGNNSFNPQRPMSQLDAGSVKSGGNTSVVHSASPMPEMDRDAQGQWRGSFLNPKPGPDPPDLNVGFQSPGSSISGTPVESQQPDLALQL